MDREPANKSMGLFAIFKEAYKLTALNKKVFSKITLTILFPLAVLFLSDIQISKFIHTKVYRGMETSRRIAYGITQSIYLILLLFFTVLSTTSVVYTVACFYTSKEITYKKVTGVLRRLWGRLISTFFWGLVMVAIYTSVALIFFSSSFSNREDILAFIIPYFPVLIYVIVIWNVATVVTVLEKDYGVKALAKSWRIIYGKRWVSCTAFGLLQIVFTGIIFTFCYLVVYGNKMNLVGKVFLGIVCYLLTTIWIHFSLVLNTVVYFVCKSYHNEDISNIANHAEVVPIIPLVGENEVQLERVPV